MLICQNIVYVNEILITVIINQATLWNKRLVRTRGMFGRFEEFFNFEEFKIKKKKSNFFWLYAKTDNYKQRFIAPKYNSQWQTVRKIRLQYKGRKCSVRRKKIPFVAVKLLLTMYIMLGGS